MLHFIDRLLNVPGIVKAYAQFNISRQVFLNSFNPLVKGLGNFNIIGAGLGYDGNAHHRHPITLKHSAQVFRSQFGTANIFKLNNALAFFFNNQVVKIVRGVKPAHGTYGQLGVQALYPTRWQLYIFTVYGIQYI